MPLPKKPLSRKDEITAEFLTLADQHIKSLLDGKTNHRMHTKDFAEKLFIHPVHLTNTVQSASGKSPCEHMEDRMVIAAQQLLKNEALSVAEVGYKLGFLDPTNFTKFYKNLSGHTPLQYRKTLRLPEPANT